MNVAPRNVVSTAALERALIFAGIALRILEWLRNRSFWIDEASLALNIAKRDYSGLLTPLDGDQAAPPAFLLLARLCHQSLGGSELSLRLAPMLAGVASVPVMAMAARRLFERPSERLGLLALFAFAGGPAYYCGEFKQYSFDVLAAALLFLLALEWNSRPNPRRGCLLAIAAAILPWFSHAAVLLIPAFGSVLLVGAALRRGVRGFVLSAATLLPGLISCALLYSIFLSGLSADGPLRDYWRAEGAFMPGLLNPDSLVWLVDSSGRFMTDLPLLHAVSPPGILLVGVGAFSGLRRVGARTPTLLALSPIPVLLVASALEAYPFADRFLLFMQPLAAVLLVRGAAVLIDADHAGDETDLTSNADRLRLARMGIGLACAAMVLIPPARIALDPARYREKEDYRSAIRFAAGSARAGDRIYFHGPASVLSWYGTRFGPAEFHREETGITFRGWDDQWIYAIHSEAELRRRASEWIAEGEANVLWCVLPDSRPQRKSIRGDAAGEILESFGDAVRVERFGGIQILRIDRRAE